MAKRKSIPTLVGQLDMFGDALGEPRPLMSKMGEITPLKGDDVIPANDTLREEIIANDVAVNDAKVVVEADGLTCQAEADSKVRSLEPSLPVHQSGTAASWLNDEWWTTAMVCAYLKLGRKAIWERQRDPRFAFPKAFHFGTMRHRWRSEDVKAWAKVCE